MQVYIVQLHTYNIDHDSGTVDEFIDIVKIFMRPEAANDFLVGKPKEKRSFADRWFSITAYEVE